LAGPEWICARCGVTTRFMEGAEVPSLPPNWSRVSEVTYCLACRRELAGEEGAATIPEDGPADDRRRADAEGRIAFEIRRAPDQGDTRVARACRTSVNAVRQVRERLGLYPTRPS
jgi:hypothetical protein